MKKSLKILSVAGAMAVLMSSMPIYARNGKECFYTTRLKSVTVTMR